MAISVVSKEEMDEMLNNNDRCCGLIDPEERDALNKLRSALVVVKKFTCPTNDSFLIRFLRTKNYDVPKTIALLDTYFRMKHDEEYLQLIPRSTYQRMYDKKIVYVLKHRDHLKRQIMHFQLGLLDLSEFTMDEMMMAAYFLFEEMTVSEETQKAGIVIILDHAGLTLGKATSFATHFKLKHMKRTVKIFQGGFPAKMKLFLFINVNVLLNSAYALLKSMCTQKLRKRLLMTTSGSECVHQFINPDVLPISLGGSLSDDDAENFDIRNAFLSKEIYYRGLHQHYGYSKQKS